MAKLRTVKGENGELYYTFHCPGCGHSHMVFPEWSFNGDMNKPTFSPSLLCWRPDDPNYRCHMFVRDGNIEYLNDCSHELAGKTIPLEEVRD